MPGLHLFYLGGNAGKSNIEVHDIQFAAVDQPEQAWGMLRESWFGDKDKVHLDGYMRIDWADGYDVLLAEEAAEAGGPRLFFVNVGGYLPGLLAEQHDFALFVAPDASSAKARALETLLPGTFQKHKDNLKDVENCLLLERIGDFYIHLRENPAGQAARPAWQGYQPIGE